MMPSSPLNSDFYAIQTGQAPVLGLDFLQTTPESGGLKPPCRKMKMHRKYHSHTKLKKLYSHISRIRATVMGRIIRGTRNLSNSQLITIRLTHTVQFPEDCLKLLNSSPYTYAARTCNDWALGRVILAGDAAHVFPPCTVSPTPIVPQTLTIFICGSWRPRSHLGPQRRRRPNLEAGRCFTSRILRVPSSLRRVADGAQPTDPKVPCLCSP